MKMSKELVQLSCKATFQRKYAMKSTVTMLKISKDKYIFSLSSSSREYSTFHAGICGQAVEEQVQSAFMRK